MDRLPLGALREVKRNVIFVFGTENGPAGNRETVRAFNEQIPGIDLQREDLARVVRESRGLGCCEVRRPQLLRRIKPVRSRRSESACKGRLDTPRPIGFERVVKPDRDFAVPGAFYPGLPGGISFVIKEAAIRDLPITRRKGEDHVTGAYSPRYPLIT